MSGNRQRVTSPLRLVSSQRADEVIAPKLPLDDDAIIAGVRRGEPAAILALHDRGRPCVDRALYRLLGRYDADHDDFVQLSMIQLVRSMEGYRGECALETWVSRITAWTVMRELAKRKTRRRVFSDAVVDDELAPSSTNVEQEVMSRDVLGRIRVHLDAIDPAKAWCVVLHDVCGYDLEEIAKITELTVAAAQSRLSRGRRDLHARLAADPELAEVLRERARRP